MSEWADQFRKLSPESSAEPGQWVTARAEYQRDIMDAVNDPAVTEVVVMTSAQIGKTEALGNIVAYYVTQDASPMLMLQPTLEMAETYSKDRLAPMVRDCPHLTDKIG
ncbi:MAG: phage terminase large subunit family protein, partial [Sphaerospermopsis kisseleviana]